MWDVLRILWRVVFAPVWLLWTCYKGLWWAFDDSDTRRAAGSATIAPPDAPPPPNPNTDAPRFTPDQSRAFEITDSTPAPAKPPIGPLRGGFVSTALISVAGAVLSSSLAEDGAITNGRAWALWIWATLMASVGTLYIVRHVARRQAEQQPKTFWGRCRMTAGGIKDAAFGAGRGVGKAYVKGVHAAKVTRNAVQKAAASPPAQAAKRGVFSAWTALRRKSQPTNPPTAAA